MTTNKLLNLLPPPKTRVNQGGGGPLISILATGWQLKERNFTHRGAGETSVGDFLKLRGFAEKSFSLMSNSVIDFGLMKKWTFLLFAPNFPYTEKF